MRLITVFLACTLCTALAIFGVLAVGCGSSNSAAPGKDGSSEGSTESGSHDVHAGDAGSDAEVNPDVYPAPHHPLPQVNDLGGTVLVNPVIVTVTFNDGPDGGPDPLASTFEAFGDTIVTSPWWHTVLSSYGVMQGTSGLHVRLPDTVSNQTVSDAQVQQLVQEQVAAGTFPMPSNSTLYALYFPASTTISDPQLGTSCVQFAGYHDDTVVTADGGAISSPAYAVINRCPQGQSALQLLQETTTTASHEFAEASSDPSPEQDTAYYLTDNDAWVAYGGLGYGNGLMGVGGEIADLCSSPTIAPYSGAQAGGFTVQRIWSNGAAAMSQAPCQPVDDYDPPRVYYGAAVDTQTIKSPQTQGPSDGYVVVPHGSTKTFNVNVFSAAPLPNALNFYVGIPKAFGETGPSDLSMMPNGVTATLSNTSGQNGTTSLLTVTVSSSAAIQDTLFVVRSVLSMTDFNDWPVILHIT
jgi:hypothetical protein